MRDPFPMNREPALNFLADFQNARVAAQQDAEDFGKVVFALERLGSFLCKLPNKGLAGYENAICALACKSPLAHPTENQRAFHTPFSELFDLVRIGRNSAMHGGVYARNLTQHAIQISLVIEDALSQIITIHTPNHSQISDHMNRHPMCADLWQPLSFIRQIMLANSFSFLPVWSSPEKNWRLVADLWVATQLRNTDGRGRRELLAQTLESASEAGTKLPIPVIVRENTTVQHTMALLEKDCRFSVALVVGEDGNKLLGIVTAFDLL